MGFTRNKDSRGQGYLVDWEEVNRIVGGFSYMRAFRGNATLGSEGNMLGKVKTVNFDTKAIADAKRRLINSTMPAIVQAVSADFRVGQSELARLRTDMMSNRVERDRKFAIAQASAQRFDWWADKAVNAAQLVRDTGFATVAVLGAPASGTIAFSAALVGAGGAAIGKYEDTGNAGSAFVAGAGSLVMTGWGALTGGLKFAGAGARAAKGIVIAMGCVFDASFETIGATLEGKSSDDATRAGILKLVTGGLGATMEVAALQKFDKLWAELKNLHGVVHWRDAGTRAALEAAKKGTDKAAGYRGTLTQTGGGILDASVQARNLNFVQTNVLRGG